MMGHILERFFIHVFSSTALILCFYYALRYWARRNSKVRNFLLDNVLLIVSGLLVFGIITQREAYDLWMGNQVWYKTIFDQVSWLLGCGLGIFGLYRFKK